LKLDKTSKIDIRSLSHMYDENNDETYISLYLDMKRGLNQKFLKRRTNACRGVLCDGDKKVLKNFDATLSLIEPNLSKKSILKGHKGTVIFASAVNEFIKIYHLPAPVSNTFVVDTSPYIRPLARMKDDYIDFLLLIISSSSASLFEISSEHVSYKKRLSKNIMNKHKKGGWSQQRFQRLRREAIGRFQKGVAKELIKQVKESDVSHLIIAGPGPEKLRFVEKLPKAIQDIIIDVVDVDIKKPDKYVIDHATSLVLKAEDDEGHTGIEVLRHEILTDGLAVYGIKEIIKASKNGTIDTLFINKNNKLRGWICEKCQLVDVGHSKKCPNCKSKTSEVDVIEEVIEFASRSDAELEFVEHNKFLESLGGVGGLLRYK